MITTVRETQTQNPTQTQPPRTPCPWDGPRADPELGELPEVPDVADLGLDVHLVLVGEVRQEILLQLRPHRRPHVLGGSHREGLGYRPAGGGGFSPPPRWPRKAAGWQRWALVAWILQHGGCEIQPLLPKKKHRCWVITGIFQTFEVIGYLVPAMC